VNKIFQVRRVELWSVKSANDQVYAEGLGLGDLSVPESYGRQESYGKQEFCTWWDPCAWTGALCV